ncbi:hypothetical protein TMU01_28780 [Tenuibacillus multivorans]|nr:hypothetical protein TMU01_28780 [Tenuibacillus multivorans]
MSNDKPIYGNANLPPVSLPEILNHQCASSNLDNLVIASLNGFVKHRKIAFSLGGN